MKQESIQKVEQALADWQYLQSLPQEWHGFHLARISEIEDDVYDFLQYTNEALHCKVFAYYHEKTDEFKLRKCISRLSYCQMECIAATRDRYEELLKRYLEGILTSSLTFHPSTISVLFRATHTLEWEYQSILPEEIEGFTLFIRPHEPLCVSNGSYIVLDYEAFDIQCSFVVYYNEFRDEFFAEARYLDIVEICYEFDAVTLAELERNIKHHLAERLRATREKGRVS